MAVLVPIVGGSAALRWQVVGHRWPPPAAGAALDSAGEARGALGGAPR